MAPRIVLASQSPRRAQLLELIGLRFDVLPADLDETYLPHEAPGDHARRLAEEKARAIARVRPDALVVGSDTVVILDGDLLGKPADRSEALATLMRLQGREHEVLSGIAVMSPTRALASGVESVRVRFRSFDEATALEYIATGEPMDKAGAYGIQGFGATIVEWIEGDYFAVMGLPIGRMIGLFRQLGWRYNFRGLEAL